MAVVYHLVAAQGKEIEELLDKAVILVDPSINPDGLSRFAHWANMHKGKNVLVTDPDNREYNEVWADYSLFLPLLIQNVGYMRFL